MRVVAGKYGGHRLVSFSGDHIRPTTDRVKEAVFNSFQEYIFGARVLDLFAGTGSLAIEAVSRGAVSVDCVDSHKKSLAIIRENLAKVKVSEPIRLFGMDVGRYLKTYTGDAYDIILVDPPFTMTMAHQVMGWLQESQAIKAGSLVAIETVARERIDEVYGRLTCYKRKDYGDKSTLYYVCQDKEKKPQELSETQ